MNTVLEIKNAIKSKEASAVEVSQDFLDRVKKLDPKLNSFVLVNDGILEEAKKVDERIAKGNAIRALDGVPVGVKEMFCTKGMKTTAASKILENFVPPYSSTVVERLQNSGALILGKVNQDEFAMGSSNETSFFGPTNNPWNLDYVPGGSSGGSAACVAARIAPVALGTDTGGSIRQPAHFCGVVGLKPTYGRVSRYGIIAFASSLDQAGPLTLTVDDSFLMLSEMCGQDPSDNTTSDQKPFSFEEAQEMSLDIKGKKVGVIKEYHESDMDADVRKIYEQGLEALKKEGAEVVEVEIPLSKVGVSIYYLVATSEAASNLGRYDGVRYGFREGAMEKKSLEDFYADTRSKGFGAEVKRRILLGNFSLSSGYFDAYYIKACQIRRKLLNEFNEAFKSCDVIYAPVASTAAFKQNERVKDPLKMFLNDYYTVSTNLAGLPGLTVPVGKTDSGMPCGVQFMAPHFQEDKLYQFGKVLENNFQFYKVSAPCSAESSTVKEAPSV